MSFADQLDNWLAQQDQAPGKPPPAPTASGGYGPDPFDPEPAPIPGALKPGSPNLVNQLDVAARGGRPFDFPATDPNIGTANQRLGTIATAGNDVVASALGAPVDAINAALRGQSWLYNTLASPHKPEPGDLVRGGAVPEERPPMTPYQIPYGGSETFRKGYEATVGRTEPKDVTDQLLYGTASGAASVLPSFAAGRAARYFGASPTTEAFLTGPQTLKGQAGNVAFGAVGGLGSELGQEAAGEDPTARALAALGGGIGLPAAVGAGLYGVQGLRNTLGARYRMTDDAPLWRRALGPSAESQAGATLRGSVDDRIAALRAYDPSEPYPGWKPSLAQSMGDDPGLVKLEGKTVGALTPGEGTPAQQALATRAEDQAQATSRALRGTTDPGAEPIAIQQEVRQRQGATQTDYERQVAEQQQRQQQAQQAEGQLVTGLGTPAAKIEDLGAAQKAELEAAKQASKDRIWGAPARGDQPAVAGMPDPDPAIRLNQTPVIDKAKDIQAGILPESKKMTPEEKAIFDNVSMWGTSTENGTPFANVNALRSNILETIRTERAVNGNTPTVARLTQLRQAIDENIADQLPQDQRDIWRAKQDAAREHAETFKDNTVGPLLDVRPAGDYKISATATPAKTIQNFETAQGYLNAGGSPETLRTALVTDLHSGGEITPERLAAWQQKREGAIRAVPGLSDELSTVAGAQAATQAAASASVAAPTKAQGILSRILDVAPADVQGVVGKLVRSPTGATDILKIRQQIAGNPDAEAGLAAAVTQHVADSFIDPKTGRTNPSAFLKFMQTQQPALQAAGVSPQNLQMLQTIADNMQRAPPGTRATVGVTATGQPSTRPYDWDDLKKAGAAMGRLGGDAAVGGGAGAAVGILAAGGEMSLAHYFGGAGVVGKLIYSHMKNAGIENTNQMLAEMLNNPAYGRAMMIQVTPQNERIIEKAVRASLQGQAATLSTGYDREKLRKDLAEQERRRLQPAMGYSIAAPTGR